MWCISKGMANLLDQFLQDNGLRQASFAERVGATQATISKLVRDETRPSLELAVRIERETKGAVPANSWVPEPDSVPAPSPETPNEDAA